MTVFELFGKLSLDSSDYDNKINKAKNETSTFAEVLKANLTSEAIIAGVKKVASVVAEIGKASYEGYAEYEQLAGGAELMFGDAYEYVSQKAKNAYKTVQLSQNDYLQQVNGLATGLKTAMGGNAQAAAELADKVVTAEADVVAATGNSQDAVQNAFNGIMKSNYSMLDNLQLGIKPTKEGMQEVIDTVNQWKQANGEAADYTIDNLADCQAALVDYIEMQGMSGYAAREALTTIEGSTASMKAAWENLATGMADENADMEELVHNFVNSVFTAGNNIVPRVKQIVAGVGSATAETISYLRETNGTIDLVVSAIEDVSVAAGVAGAGLVANLAGNAVRNIATIFTENAMALKVLTIESGRAAVQEATLNGTFTVTEIAVGVLTGKISLATAAQYAWNTAIAANPLGVLAVGLGAVTAATVRAVKSQKEHIAAMAGEPQTVEEARAALDELRAGYDAAVEARNAMFESTCSYDDTKEMMDYADAIKIAEENLKSLEEQEKQAAEAQAEAVAKAAAEAEEPANRLKSATEDYYTTVNDIISKTAETYDQISQKAASWYEPFEKVTSDVKVKIEDMTAGLQSQIEYFQNYSENVKTLTEAGMGGFVTQLSSMGTEGAAWAQAMVDKLNEAGGATSEKTQEMVKDFEALISTRDQAMDEFSSSMALGVNDTINQIGQVTEDYIAQIKEWDQTGEATQSALNTMDGLKSGLTSGASAVYTQLTAIGKKMTDALQSGIGTVYIDVKVRGDGAQYLSEDTVTINASARSGLDYVPFDGFIAELHKGERVLTAAEARRYRAEAASLKSSGNGTADNGTGSRESRGITIIQNITSAVQSEVELAAATEAYFTQARWAM